MRGKSPVIIVVLLCCSALMGCRDATDRTVDTIAGFLRGQQYDELAALVQSDEPEVRCRAAKALAWARGPGTAPHHLKLLNFESCGWEVRAEAAWRLFEAERWSDAPAIVPLLSAKERELRWNAARVLGNMKNTEVLVAVDGCTSDPDEFVAAWCTWAGCFIRGSADCHQPNMDMTNGKPAP